MVPVADERIREKDRKQLGHHVPVHVSVLKRRLAFCSKLNDYSETVSNGSWRRHLNKRHGQRNESSTN